MPASPSVVVVPAVPAAPSVGVAVPRSPLRVAWGDDRVHPSVSRTSHRHPRCRSLVALGWVLASSLVGVALEAVVPCWRLLLVDGGLLLWRLSLVDGRLLRWWHVQYKSDLIRGEV